MSSFRREGEAGRSASDGGGPLQLEPQDEGETHLDRLAVAEDLRVRRHDAVLGRVRLHHLELHGAHAAARQERVALADGAVGLEEVGLEVGVEERAGDALDGVVDGEDVDALAVLDVGALLC